MAVNFNNALPKGTKLNSDKHQYTILEVLGAGGFGITYRVQTFHGKIPVDMAIKEHFMASVCERNDTQDVAYSTPVKKQVEDALKDFITEANRLNSLDLRHPNIISIDEVFRANNTAYYVMEYIKHPSIGHIIRSDKGKPFPEKKALGIIKPILDAVALLHSNKITHLDIKPDNILLDFNELTETDRPVLIDFGLSKHYDDNGNPTSTLRISGCSEGYAPIEQYAGISVFTPQADVYALAATLFFMLTGTNPPAAANISADDIRTALAGKCSQLTARAIVRAMEFSKQARTQSVADFAAELGFLIGNGQPSANVQMPQEPIDRGHNAARHAAEMQEAEVKPQHPNAHASKPKSQAPKPPKPEKFAKVHPVEPPEGSRQSAAHSAKQAPGKPKPPKQTKKQPQPPQYQFGKQSKHPNASGAGNGGGSTPPPPQFDNWQTPPPSRNNKSKKRWAIFITVTIGIILFSTIVLIVSNFSSEPTGDDSDVCVYVDSLEYYDSLNADDSSAAQDFPAEEAAVELKKTDSDAVATSDTFTVANYN